MADSFSVSASTAEARRLEEDARRERNWKRWGPYLSERQWGTVREDYSPNGDSWNYFPHDHARSRAYRWGEDGLLGICDRQCRLCFSLALWNGVDPILKERLFGLTGPEGNHAEDVKELYYYLDATPTSSYLKALYKYPLLEFPYSEIVRENARRDRLAMEFELLDTGRLRDQRYADVLAEYAKGGPDDIAIRLTLSNRSGERASLWVLPTLWFRNTWSWGRVEAGMTERPILFQSSPGTITAQHPTLGRYVLRAGVDPAGRTPSLLFTDNESNIERLHGVKNSSPYVKDAFHRYVVHGDSEALSPAAMGTKSAALYRIDLDAGQSVVLKLRLSAAAENLGRDPLGDEHQAIFLRAKKDADDHFDHRWPRELSADERTVARQAEAGLLWSKQFYYYAVNDWLEGDPAQPKPPVERNQGRNRDWRILYNRDVISMCDKWEYPWYAAWDLAFHMIAFARLDPQFAKDQLLLFLREWYMHPNGQIPAYEFALGDVNPPVHAWACWRVYKMTGPRGGRDRVFLARCFQKLLLNFTWWVNRKDLEGRHLFAGGFLGMDNIGVFDRSQPLPHGGRLEQADATAWMAFYCATMLSMALELATYDPAYEDLASKFFEHFVHICDAMNVLGGTGLWNERDGFYYDQVHCESGVQAMAIRSMVGLLPLIACESLEQEVIDRLPGFGGRLRWFLQNRSDLSRHVSYMRRTGDGPHCHYLLAIPSQDRLKRVLSYMLDEKEFLAPYGIRSLSMTHRDQPFILTLAGHTYEVRYSPGESEVDLFGGNSNWRGPVWFPVNYLLIEALDRYDHYFGDGFRVECPTGSGNWMRLSEVAQEISARLTRLFLPDDRGHRPCHGGDPIYAEDPHFRDLVLFYEYFDPESGRGLGASHQTGWTALVAPLLRSLARRRRQAPLHDARNKSVASRSAPHAMPLRTTS